MGDATPKTEGTDENEGGKSRKKPGPVVVPKSAYDVQRLRLERLFANPDKPVVIPPSAPRGAKKPHEAPEFVRNVMGSSAGAGSGEFHVYRHLRRKEYARQKYIEQQARQEEKDAEYKRRLEENRRRAEERTAKKRAKRQKRKQNIAKRKKEGKKESQKDSGSSDEEDSAEERGETTTGDEQHDDPQAVTSADGDPVEKDPTATAIANEEEIAPAPDKAEADVSDTTSCECADNTT